MVHTAAKQNYLNTYYVVSFFNSLFTTFGKKPMNISKTKGNINITKYYNLSKSMPVLPI